MDWRPIPAFPGYEASADGQIRKGDKVKQLSLDDKGYLVTSVARRPRRVARLIATAFLGLDYFSPVLTVDHVDRNTQNNAIANLRIADPAIQSANRDKANIAKGKRIPVEQLDKLTGSVLATHTSVQEASRAIGRGNGGAGAICNAIHGKLKSAYGFKWRFQAQDAPPAADEDWQPFEDIYVSDLGRIRRMTATGHRFYGPDDYGKDGRYAIVTVKGRRWPVHRLMAVVFLGLDKDESSQRVIFKDGNPANLTIDNIEIVQRAVATDAKGPSRPVGQWTHDGTTLLNRFESVAHAARALKLDASSISKAARGRVKHVGNYAWNFID